jgi:DNA adenine methylase
MSSVKAEFIDLRHVVKWPGAKRQLLSELDKLIPRQFNRYYEPFLGGGALFFHLVSSVRRFTAYLSDTNVELITTYKVIKDNPKGVIELLQKYEYEYKRYPPYSEEQKECYYRLRYARNNIKSSSDVETAFGLIALNKTGYNGLYRVNNNGKFNVPWGEYKNPNICDSSNLENVSNALRYSSAIISTGDYRDAIENAQKGDFVYLDPPYNPVSYTSNFTAYTPNGFGREDQVQLAEVFRKLDNRGCLLLLSNTPFIIALYSDFSAKEVDVQRAINCKGSKRTAHKELLIYNYS